MVPLVVAPGAEVAVRVSALPWVVVRPVALVPEPVRVLRAAHVLGLARVLRVARVPLRAVVVVRALQALHGDARAEPAAPVAPVEGLMPGARWGALPALDPREVEVHSPAVSVDRYLALPLAEVRLVGQPDRLRIPAPVPASSSRRPIETNGTWHYLRPPYNQDLCQAELNSVCGSFVPDPGTSKAQRLGFETSMSRFGTSSPEVCFPLPVLGTQPEKTGFGDQTGVIQSTGQGTESQMEQGLVLRCGSLWPLFKWMTVK